LSKFYRINQYIKASSVRVIDHEGKQIGVLPTPEAIAKAQSLDMDLVEVAAGATPPVARIVDFVKFRYQEEKKQRLGQKTTQDTKEIRFGPFMEDNDINIRLNRVRDFLSNGNRVKLVVKFSGREITRKQFGEQLLAKAIEQLKDVSTLVEPPKLMGKLLIAQIKPNK